MKETFVNTTRSSFAISILDNLFKKPIISASELAHYSSINNPTTSNKIFKKLLNSSVISVFKETKGNRAVIYSFNRLIKIIDE
jgi:hypothetical protein